MRQWAPHAYDSPQHGDAVFFQYGWHRKDEWETRARRTMVACTASPHTAPSHHCQLSSGATLSWVKLDKLAALKGRGVLALSNMSNVRQVLGPPLGALCALLLLLWAGLRQGIKQAGRVKGGACHTGTC